MEKKMEKLNIPFFFIQFFFLVLCGCATSVENSYEQVCDEDSNENGLFSLACWQFGSLNDSLRIFSESERTEDCIVVGIWSGDEPSFYYEIDAPNGWRAVGVEYYEHPCEEGIEEPVSVVSASGFVYFAGHSSLIDMDVTIQVELEGGIQERRIRHICLPPGPCP